MDLWDRAVSGRLPMIDGAYVCVWVERLVTVSVQYLFVSRTSAFNCGFPGTTQNTSGFIIYATAYGIITYTQWKKDKSIAREVEIENDQLPCWRRLFSQPLSVPTPTDLLRGVHTCMQTQLKNTTTKKHIHVLSIYSRGLNYVPYVRSQQTEAWWLTLSVHTHSDSRVPSHRSQA